MNFWETILIASIPAVIAGLVAFFGNRYEYLRYRSDSMPERSVRKYLKHKDFTDRKFDTIKKRIGGYDEDDDELRRILVRAGSERRYRDEEGIQVEYWTLISRANEKLNKRRKNNREKQNYEERRKS